MFRFLILKCTLALIWIYQKTISFDHGLLRRTTPYGRCKFYPTCSEYAKQALLKYGILKGTLMTIARLGRCNPWSKGGVDEP